MSDDFTKLPAPAAPTVPEDIDRNGLTERTSVRWLLWVTDSLTVFCRGVLAGMFPGVGGSIGAVAFTDSTQPQTLLANGALGFAAGLLVKGLERLHMWQAKPENEMPNPFRP